MKTRTKTGLLILVLASVAVRASAADPEKAQLVTGDENAMRCLSSVAINEIDGEAQLVPERGFELEPGMHSMNGRARLNIKYCRVTDDRSNAPVPDLEAEFEAGKIYYVGLDHSSESIGDWHLVIWKVEDMGAVGTPF